MEYVGCSLPDDTDRNNNNNNAIFINAAAMDMGAFMAHVCACPNSITVERNAPFRTPYILPRGYAIGN